MSPRMRIAFHTPLKPLDHPTPSGDRSMARALAAILHRLGHEVIAVDRHQPGRRGLVEPGRLAEDRDRHLARLPELIGQRPDLWFTYHLWYKRPDWLGPGVSAALNIPYVVAEASYAPKRAGGPWDVGHRAVGEAIAAADLVLTLNPDDAPMIAPLLRTPDAAATIPPFLDVEPFRAVRRPPRDGVPMLLAVGMMRPGDKLASYRLLADALQRVRDLDWRLMIVGDGEVRGDVEAAFAPLVDRVVLHGAAEAAGLPAIYAAADLLVWPAINEAYGIALLEAQAAGLPVVAGRTRGVPAVIGDGESGLLPALGDAQAFADAVRALLVDPARRAALAAGAGARVDRDHDLPAAQARIGAALAAMLARRATGAAA
ncbi:MAG: glycosyltransferase family 4 protein [Alphaproteobacteria bacterium]|nr:glycosyltransferase family 4 protein [Alphaproteobacteria bacterium]MCW5741114.1 glycosyltransferase family 4 protein [Alphaproteobacteria bacterium]